MLYIKMYIHLDCILLVDFFLNVSGGLFVFLLHFFLYEDGAHFLILNLTEANHRTFKMLLIEIVFLPKFSNQSYNQCVSALCRAFKSRVDASKEKVLFLFEVEQSVYVTDM